MPNQRDISIDIAKGICIFLMVMGHAAVPGFVFKWIYSFHMPFFFLVSGMFFNPVKYDKWHCFLKSRVKGLVIPYFSLSVFVTMLFALIGQLNFKAMFVGWGGVALWFIPVLFVSEVLFYAIWKMVARFKYSRIYALACAIIVLVAGYYCSIRQIRFPLQLQVAGMGCFFYAVGYLFSGWFKTISLKAWLVCVLMCVYMGAIQWLPTLDMCPNNFGCFPLNQLMAIAGSLLVICLARVIVSWNDCNPFYRFFNWVGKNTLVIVGFSQVIMAMINHYGSDYIGVMFSVIKYIGIWGVLYILSRMFNKYIPFVVGK